MCRVLCSPRVYFAASLSCAGPWVPSTLAQTVGTCRKRRPSLPALRRQGGCCWSRCVCPSLAPSSPVLPCPALSCPVLCCFVSSVLRGCGCVCTVVVCGSVCGSARGVCTVFLIFVCVILYPCCVSMFCVCVCGGRPHSHFVVLIKDMFV